MRRFHRALRIAILAITIAVPAMMSSFVYAAPPRCAGAGVLSTPECYGYNTGNYYYDSTQGLAGQNILYNTSNIGDWAIPTSVNTAPELIAFMKNLLGTSTAYNYNRAGAAFLIDTMMWHPGNGSFGSTTAAIAYAQDNFNQWALNVQGEADASRIDWNDTVTLHAGDVDSMHVCSKGTSTSNCTLSGIIGGSHDAKDFAFYVKEPDDGDEVSHEIVFKVPGGGSYRIRRECGNLVGLPSRIPTTTNYNLTPGVSYGITEGGAPIAGNVAQVGDTVKFTYTVKNGGGASGSTTCQIYGNREHGAYDIPTPRDKSSNYAYTAPSTGCPRTFSTNSTTTLATETITITNADVNYTLCRSLWVDPARAGGADAGAEGCVVVAAKPYVKVFGGDVSAGAGVKNASGTCTSGTGEIDAWNRETAGGFSGAGARYAVMALGAIQDFASAQNIGGATAPSSLTFANTGAGVVNTSTGLYGGSLSSINCVPDYYSKMPSSGVTALTSTIDVSSLRSGAYSATGDVTITGGNINPNQRTVLYITGNSRVYIAGNITYTGSWSSDSMPLFEIVGKGSNFFVKNTVTRLDGAYIAQPNGATGGEIDDCATGFGEISLTNPAATNPYATCNYKLTVNGLFSAAKVLLLRMPGTVSRATATETPASNNAAEVFNYNPSMWIAQPPASAVSGGTSVGDSYQAITSLPPVL